MDNTELHYLTYDPDAIWDEMITAYVEAGGDILYPGDEKEMLLRSVQADIVQIFAGVDNALRMHTLRYAVGEYLDLLGEMRGCERIKASAATATVEISTNATGEAATLPAGTTMTADGVLFYALTEDLALTGYAQTVTATIECTETGSGGNGLAAGTSMDLATSHEAVNSITVATDATGGNEQEEDEPYRDRIRAYGLATVTTGPSQMYEGAAEAVSTNILDAKAINTSAGNVGIYLIFSTQTGKAAIMAAVEEALSTKDVRPLTDHVTVYEATDVPYVLDVQYVCDGSSQTLTAISEAVSNYQDWQDNEIGRPFNPDRLMAALYQAGCTRVSWIGNSGFDGGGLDTVVYTEIEANERCSGTITLSAGA